MEVQDVNTAGFTQGIIFLSCEYSLLIEVIAAMFYVEVEKGVKLFVNDLNPTGNKPILFIHGWPVNHKMFEYQYNILPRSGYRCVLFDIRGFGQSDAPWGGYDYDRLADDTRIVADTLKLENFILAGFSVGGAIAIRYMARHKGHNVRKLALISAAAPSFVQRPGFPYGMTVSAVNNQIAQTYYNRPQMLTEFGVNFFASKITPSFRGWFQSLGLSASSYGTIKLLESLRNEDLRQDLASIRVPTGIFHGALDKICPFPLAEAQNRGIRDSKLFRFAKSGHGVFYDELESFNNTFLGFLES